MFMDSRPHAEVFCGRRGVWHQTEVGKTARCSRSLQSGLGGKCEDSSQSRNTFRFCKMVVMGVPGSSDERDLVTNSSVLEEPTPPRWPPARRLSPPKAFFPGRPSVPGSCEHQMPRRLPATPKNQLGAGSPPGHRPSVPTELAHRLPSGPLSSGHSLCLESIQSSLGAQIQHRLCKCAPGPSGSFPIPRGPGAAPWPHAARLTLLFTFPCP